MKTIPAGVLGLALLVPLASVHATALTLIGAEGDHAWSLSDSFEGLSYYGSSGNSSVNYLTTPVSVLGGLGTLSLSSPSGGLAVYGQPSGGAGAASGSGVPDVNSDFPGFVINSGYAGTAHSSSKGLGTDSLDSVVRIEFSQAVAAFGLYASADMSSLLSVSLFDVNGSLIDGPVDIFAFSNSLDFWGWESPVGIGSIEISGDYIALDHLVVQSDTIIPPPPPPAIPEIATVAPALAALLAGAELARRRRR
jgi:hypothetical protein